jgi:phosphonate degradation associated HDIG domain protein
MERAEAMMIADEIFDLYLQHGQSDYIGEPVSQLEHMLQSAQIAEKEGYDGDFVLAAFFHDIGHLCEHIRPAEKMEDVGVVDHETIGMMYLLGKGFSRRVAKLVGGHVEAKRYLSKRDSGYYDRLSDASRKTLEFQGGPMSEEEALAFESDPLFHEHIRMRLIDDAAKSKGKPVPDLDKYWNMAVEHLISRNS